MTKNIAKPIKRYRILTKIAKYIIKNSEITKITKLKNNTIKQPTNSAKQSTTNSSINSTS